MHRILTVGNAMATAAAAATGTADAFTSTAAAATGPTAMQWPLLAEHC